MKTKISCLIHNLNSHLRSALNHSEGSILSLAATNNLILQMIQAKGFKIIFQSDRVVRIATNVGEIICYLAGCQVRVIGFYSTYQDRNGEEFIGQ